jgi:hypothetical protein
VAGKPGWHHSEETKRKLRSLRHSDETKARISATQKRKWKRLKKLLARDDAERARANA